MLIKENDRTQVVEIKDGNGNIYVKKFYKDMNAFQTEKAAYEIFKEYSWLPNLIEVGHDYLILDKYDENLRLDKYAINLSVEERLELSGEVLNVILTLHSLGYAHRDMHSKNIFIINNKVKLIDYETLTNIPENTDFENTYDITGKGLESPYRTNNMCYNSSNKYSIKNTLKVDFIEAKERLRSILYGELQINSSNFQTLRGKHATKMGVIYSSFNTPQLVVNEEIAQRNNALRLEKFRVNKEDLKLKSVLDLGSNVGGMLFEISNFEISTGLGIEYDNDKVNLSNKIAKLNNFNNIVFKQGDLNFLNHLDRKFDVVLCLAIEGHISNKANLFNLLGEYTNELLLFEGNSNSNIDFIKVKLQEVGFESIEYLGFCIDDKLNSNNNRPLFKAYKNKRSN